MGNDGKSWGNFYLLWDIESYHKRLNRDKNQKSFLKHDFPPLTNTMHFLFSHVEKANFQCLKRGSALMEQQTGCPACRNLCFSSQAQKKKTVEITLPPQLQPVEEMISLHIMV